MSHNGKNQMVRLMVRHVGFTFKEMFLLFNSINTHTHTHAYLVESGSKMGINTWLLLASLGEDITRIFNSV